MIWEQFTREFIEFKSNNPSMGRDSFLDYTIDVILKRGAEFSISSGEGHDPLLAPPSSKTIDSFVKNFSETAHGPKHSTKTLRYVHCFIVSKYPYYGKDIGKDLQYRKIRDVFAERYLRNTDDFNFELMQKICERAKGIFYSHEALEIDIYEISPFYRNIIVISPDEEIPIVRFHALHPLPKLTGGAEHISLNIDEKIDKSRDIYAHRVSGIGIPFVDSNLDFRFSLFLRHKTERSEPINIKIETRDLFCQYFQSSIWGSKFMINTTNALGEKIPRTGSMLEKLNTEMYSNNFGKKVNSADSSFDLSIETKREMEKNDFFDKIEEIDPALGMSLNYDDGFRFGISSVQATFGLGTAKRWLLSDDPIKHFSLCGLPSERGGVYVRADNVHLDWNSLMYSFGSDI